jgi:hypothetical protein
MSSCILVRIRNVSNKRCRKNQNTHFMFRNFCPKIMPFMRILRKIWWNRRPQMAIWRRVACLVSKTTRTQTRLRQCTHKCVILIVLRRQYLFLERHAQAALPPAMTRYPFYRRLTGPTDGLDECRKSSLHLDSIPGPSSP